MQANSNLPYRYAEIDPAAVIFPLASRDGVQRQEDVRVYNLNALVAPDECGASRELRVFDSVLIELGSFLVEPRSYAADLCASVHRCRSGDCEDATH